MMSYISPVSIWNSTGMPTRYPEPYWEEALRRDAFDSRCNAALGLLKLRRGRFAEPKGTSAVQFSA